jgi:hypothetical protein
LSAFQWNILKPLVTLQTLRISHDLLATYPEQSWIDLSNITHVFTIESPTEMFGMLETYLTSASSLDVKLKIVIQTVMAEKRLIPQHKFDRTVQILKFLLKCL